MLALQHTVVEEQMPPTANRECQKRSNSTPFGFMICCGGGTPDEVELTSEGFAGSICPFVVRVAAEGCGIVPAVVALFHRWLRLGLLGLLRFGGSGGTGNRAGSEESRDGEDLGEMHCE